MKKNDNSDDDIFYRLNVEWQVTITLALLYFPLASEVHAQYSTLSSEYR